jgi:hypothetical protein
MTDVGLWHDDHHRYYYGDVGPLVSVTTAVDIIRKPALEQWGRWEVAACAVRNADILPNLIAEQGDKKATAWLKSIPDLKRDVKADLGTRVHKLAEAIIAGWTPEVSDDERPYVRSFVQFFEDNDPSYVLVEALVCHLGFSYGGKFDGIADIKGTRYLLDLKTSKSVFPEVALQLAGYRYAEFIGHKDRVDQDPIPEVDRCAVVHLRPDGYSLVEFNVDWGTFAGFTAALNLHNWVHKIAKGAIVK